MAMNAAGRARVQVTEQDISVRTPAGRGNYAACVVPSMRGPTHPILVTSPARFNQLYTSRNRIEVGEHLGMYACRDTVMYTNKVWMCRAVSPSALIGGLNVWVSTATPANTPFPAGFKSVEAFDPVAATGYPELNDQVADFSDNVGLNANVRITGALWAMLKTGSIVDVTSGSVGSLAPQPLGYGTPYYAIMTPTPNIIKLALNLANAQAGTNIDILNSGTGVQFMGTPTSAPLAAGQERRCAIFAKSPGRHDINLSVKITLYASDKIKVKEPGCYAIEVFNYGVLVEKLIVSHDPKALGLDGRSLYIEEVAERSTWIDIVDNPVLATTVNPKESRDVSNNFITQTLGGGDDGAALTDGDMIRALVQMESRANYPVTMVHDSGWVTIAYAQRLEQFCETREDCSFIEVVPFVDEASADYMTRIDTWASVSRISDSSYGGMFTPHLVAYDDANNRWLHLPASGVICGMYCRAFDIYRPGEPVAGLEKGSLNYPDLLRRYEDGELDFLYDINVNPIRWKRGTGIHIWGQKTRQRRPSAMDRMNVRTLLNLIKGPYGDALEAYLFRLNQLEDDIGIRAEIVSVIDARASVLKAMGSIYDYKTICDSSINTPNDVDNHILRVHHLIKPAISIEYIDFVIGITSTSLDFAIAETLVF